MTTPTAAAAASRLFRPTPTIPPPVEHPEAVLVSLYRLELTAGANTSIYKAGGPTRIVLPANNPKHALSALSVSFYYQPAASNNSHTLLAGAPTAGNVVGDFLIRRLTDGKLFAWHVGQDGGMRFFGGSSGITGTNLAIGTAYQITMTLGPGGAKLYLREAGGAASLVAQIPQNINGWNNAREKYLGVWVDGVSDPAEGAFDHLRIWSGELQDSGVAALEAPVSVSLTKVTAWANSISLNGTAALASQHDFTVLVPAGLERAAMVALATNNSSTVTSVVLDPAGASIGLTKARSNGTGASRMSLWRLLELQMPTAGSYTLRVTLNVSARPMGQWQAVINVDQQVFATGNWERNATSLPLRADRVYPSGSLAFAAALFGEGRTGVSVSQLFKQAEIGDAISDATFAAARGQLTVAGAPEPTFSHGSNTNRIVGIQAFLQPAGSVAPTLRTINRPATGDWADHGTKVSPVGSTWEDGIAGTGEMNGLAALEWLNDQLYCLYIGYDGDATDGGPRHRALGYATSQDGFDWTKYGNNPVITHHGSGTNNQQEGVLGFAAAVDPRTNALNVAWGALEQTGAATVRSDLSLTVTSDGVSWSDNTYLSNDIIINATAGVFLGCTGGSDDDAYGFALAWNTELARWELYYLTQDPEAWHVYHVHATDLAIPSAANDADFLSMASGASGREWRIGTLVNRRNGNYDLFFNRFTTGGQFEIAYRPITTFPSAGALSTLYDFDVLDATTQRGYCGITPAVGIGKWVLPYWLTAEDPTDRTQGIRFKTASIAYASAANGTPVDDLTESYAPVITGIAGLVAYWRLSDTTDAVGSLDLTAVGGPSFAGIDLPPGSLGGSMSVVPTQYCQVVHGAALDLAALSVVFWARPASLHDGAIVSKRTTPGTAPVQAQDWTVRVGADGTINSFGYDGTSTQSAPTSAGFYTAGQTLVGAVLLGGGSSMSLYINGVLEAFNEDYALGWDENVSALRIGYAGYDAHPFNGLIDEVAIFNRRLTQDEIRTLSRVAPIAPNVDAGTAQATGSPVAIDLASHGGARSTATFTLSPISQNFGSWALNGSIVTYTPANTGEGTDTASYTVNDGELGSAVGSISIDVVAEAPAPEDNYAAEVAGISNLLAYWRLGDASAGTLADSSGSGHTGSYNGSPAFRVGDLTEAWQASDGFAVNLNATGHGIVAHNAAFALAQGSLSFWFRVNTLTGSPELITKGTALRVRVTSTGALECLIGSMTLATIAGVIGAGEDHHCMVSWTPRTVYLWLDGRYVDKTPGLSQYGSWPVTKHTSGLTTNSSSWRFGGSSGGAHQNVRLDEAALYGRSLTFEELTALSQRMAGMGYQTSQALDVINVSNAAGLSSALSSAAPGDHIVLANGTYSGSFILTANGTRENPIVIRSANGTTAVTISGTGIELRGAWNVLDGVTISPGSRCELEGKYNRGTRIRHLDRTVVGIDVVAGANFSRVDHSFIGPTNNTSATGTRHGIRLRLDGSAASACCWYSMVDHCHVEGGGDVILGATPLVFGNDRNSLGACHAYKVLSLGPADTGAFELKNTGTLVQKCTINSPKYSHNRHGAWCEWRSCYNRGGGDHLAFGRDHLIIGGTFNGSGTNLRLGPGDALEADYYDSPWGTGAGGRPASEDCAIVGITFLNGAKVEAGEPTFTTGVDARGATAEGCTNFSVTHNTTHYIGTLTHNATTNEPFETAVELGTSDVGLSAPDPLVPPGWK